MRWRVSSARAFASAAAAATRAASARYWARLAGSFPLPPELLPRPRRHWRLFDRLYLEIHPARDLAIDFDIDLRRGRAGRRRCRRRVVQQARAAPPAQGSPASPAPERDRYAPFPTGGWPPGGLQRFMPAVSIVVLPLREILAASTACTHGEQRPDPPSRACPGPGPGAAVRQSPTPAPQARRHRPVGVMPPASTASWRRTRPRGARRATPPARKAD